MPLIKSRGKRPNSSTSTSKSSFRNDTFSFLPFFISALDPRGLGGGGGGGGIRGGKPQKHLSHSSPPPPPTPSSSHFDIGIHTYSPFSSSTPPSTCSKGSVNGMPSSQGVFDTYEHQMDVQFEPTRSGSKKERTAKRDRRDTLRLPMMLPTPMDQLSIDKDESKDEYDHIVSKPTCQKNRAVSQIDAGRLRCRVTDQPSTSSPCQNTSQISNSPTRHSAQMLPVDSAGKNGINQWLGPEDEDLDDVEYQALDVLRTLDGHLQRDGFGYATGTGTGKGSWINAEDTSNSRKGSDSPSTKSRNSTSRVSNVRLRSGTLSTVRTTSEKDSSEAGITNERKRIRSHRYSGVHIAEIPYPEQHQSPTAHTKRSSDSNSTGPPPPRPPPPHSKHTLPPVSMTQTHASVDQHTINDNRLFDRNDDQGTHVNEKDKHMAPALSGYSQSESHSRIQMRTFNDQTDQRIISPPSAIPPRSASCLGEFPLGRNQTLLRMPSSSHLRQSDSAPAVRRGSKEKEGVKVPLILSSANMSPASPITSANLEDDEFVVVIDQRPRAPSRETTLSYIPLHQQPLPPIPISSTLPSLSPSSSSQRNTLSSVAHPRLATRFLRPKRPVTAPHPPPLSASQIISPSRPLTRLIPREEPRRPASFASRAEADAGQKGMTVLSFLALNEIGNGSRSFGRRNSFSRLTSATDFTSGYYPARMESPTRGLEGGYIIPPAERSKIGSENRKQARRRRKNSSRSTLSSIAVSEVSSPEEEWRNDHEQVEWSTAREFERSKSRMKEKEKDTRLGFSFENIDINRSFTPNRNKPSPLNIFSFSRDQEAEETRYPKSAGLLPPPRPRRGTTPSVPLVMPSKSQNQQDCTISIALNTGTSFERKSPKHIRKWFDTNTDSSSPRALDEMKDSMDLGYSPCDSPSLTTPGQSYVFSPYDIDNQQNQLRTVSIPTSENENRGGGVSGGRGGEDESSNWSSSDGPSDRERQIITSLWLASKPTRTGSGKEEKKEDHHPFYTGKKGGNGGVVIDGGYGKRGSFGVDIRDRVI
ncbi:uncharacterized protein IL334_000292 [Kwoniella shivajii]|uniref:Uncharacterized protein n=1 Tax=Kwoniella shivajii TaxID=564305 RepID=A0ABZ1CSY9_9TREE|nr:hypothetical protein IL334_000292 [Kwoniella shivajii]